MDSKSEPESAVLQQYLQTEAAKLFPRLPAEKTAQAAEGGDVHHQLLQARHNASFNDDGSSSSNSGDSNLQARLQRQEQQDRENASLTWKLFAFSCTLLLGFGSHYSAHVLSSLKSDLKQDLNINNAQYGALQAAVSVVNTIVPLLGGRFIDVFGVSNGSILSCTLTTVGSLLLPLSAHWHSFTVMVLGRLLYGLGSMIVVTAQHTILAHWFRGSALAVTIGIQIATSRLASFLAVLTAIPLRDVTGWYGYAFWVAFVLCAASLVVDVVYVQGMRVFYNHQSDDEIYGHEELAKLRKKMRFQLGDIYEFPPLFWTIAWSSFLLGSIWTGFLHISPELISKWFDQNERDSAANSAIGQLVPIILAPFLGYFIDRKGQRPLLVGISIVTLLASFLLLWKASWPPAVALSLFSLSLALGPVAMVSAVGLMIAPGAIGTALGIYKAMNNIGSTILDPLLGMLQDATNSYDSPLALLTSLTAVSMLFIVALVYLDHTHEPTGLLSAGSAQRKEILAKLDESNTSRHASRRASNLQDSEARPLLSNESSQGPSHSARISGSADAPWLSSNVVRQADGHECADHHQHSNMNTFQSSQSTRSKRLWGRAMVGTMAIAMLACWALFLLPYMQQKA